MGEPAMKFDWTPRNTGIVVAGVMSAIFALPKLGDGLDYLRKVLGTTEVAYAAKEQAEDTASEFQQYLQRQEAYTEALNSYVAQQQDQVRCEEENDGKVWCCSVQFTDQECDERQLWRRRR